MHHRGAKHFIFFSRSGASSAAARELCADLRAAGCAVSDMICDTTDAQAVAKAMAQCEASMPPIRGCLQASMVLEVGAWFE